jgi:hypothetical protein
VITNNEHLVCLHGKRYKEIMMLLGSIIETNKLCIATQING